MSRKKSDFESFGCLLVAAISLLFLIPVKIWVTIAFLIALGFIVYLFSKKQEGKVKQEAEEKKIFKEITMNTRSSSMVLPKIKNQENKIKNSIVSNGSSEKASANEDHCENKPRWVASSELNIESFETFDYDDQPNNFKIPNPSRNSNKAMWNPPGSEIEFAHRKIVNSMVYTGTFLPSIDGCGNDPCLLTPSKQVCHYGDCTQRQMSYWPNYSDISPEARAAYLDWLASGRRNPDADIGYVFLFFYGLERRMLFDSEADSSIYAEWPAIEHELQELMEVYGSKSGSFQNYASDLLNWIQFSHLDEKLYEKPFDIQLQSNKILPFKLKIALGQAVVDNIPISVNMALAWLLSAPEINLRTPVKRCFEEFTKLFIIEYQKEYDKGMVVPPNRTKLKFCYHPASSSFRGLEYHLPLGDLPDISFLTKPLKKLQDLVDKVSSQIEPYSRFIGRNTEAAGTMSALMLLPLDVWPENIINQMSDLKTKIGDDFLILTFNDLMQNFGMNEIALKQDLVRILDALKVKNIEMEPDVLSGVKPPKPEDNIVLFSVNDNSPVQGLTKEYQFALLNIQMASAVAAADGIYDAKEVSHLNGLIESWTQLSPGLRKRLKAHLQLLQTTPVSLAIMKKKLEPLDSASKEIIATRMVTLAQVDGNVAPAEIKVLEKIYRTLDLDPAKVIQHLHKVAAGVSITSAKTGKQEFKLDRNKIAELQKDTEKVSTLLAGIFVEEALPPVEPEMVETDATPELNSLFGLDQTLSDFARHLLSQMEWAQAELQDIAADLELMLDGALEQINEMAYDQFDMAFIEGEDPLTINPEILEKIKQ